MRRVIDLTGRRFGELTALEDTGKRKKGGGAVWLCRCSCGKLSEHTANALTSGNTTSCGHKKRGPNISGQTFGELTAIEPTGKRYRGSVVWRCQCSCGKICEVSQANLVSGNTTSCGHKKIVDLTGKRFGRLVAIKPQRVRMDYAKHSIAWLCKCDCGSAVIAPSATLVNGLKKSCGCLGRGKYAGSAKCPACGKRFPVELNGEKTPQFCPECAPKYAGRNWKVCPVCGKLFPSPASAKTVTCSKECSSAWKQITHDGVSNKWSDESREKKRMEGQTENLRMGTPAAQKSPIAGRFETNQEAKIWRLVDPSGNEVVVRNLSLWARENTERFGKPDGDKSAEQIVHGFYAIAETLRGTRKNKAMTYFGWTLKDVPKEPEE